MKKNNNVFIFFLFVLLSSVILNILIINKYDFDYFKIDFIKIINLNKNGCDNLIYVFFKRIKQLLIVVVLMKVFNSEKIYKIVISILGVFLGFCLTVQVYYSGLDGVSMLLVYVFPHFIIYFILLKYLLEMFGMSIEKNEKIKIICSVVVLFCIGIVCEEYFSEKFLIKYYQYIVTKN